MEQGFRGKSASMQFLLLMLLCATGLLLSLLIGGVAAGFIFNIDRATLQDLMATPQAPEAIEVVKFMQGVFSIGLFLVPALVAARLLSADAGAYLGTDFFPKPPVLLIGLIGLLTLSAAGVSDLLYQAVKSISLPPSWEVYFSRQEEITQRQYTVFLQMPGTLAFLKSFLLMAVLPAVCEETLFRGVLQPIFKKGFRNRHLAIWLTAFCFSLVHANFYAFFSILLLGAVLGYLREWTGSLWVPVLLHLFNNGIIVSAVYFGGVSLDQLNDVSIQNENGWISLGSVMAFVLLLYLIYRAFSKNEEEAGEVA